MIRGIIFDCFGVLYGGSTATFLSLCPPDKLDELKNLIGLCDRGYITTEEFFADMSQLLGMPRDELVAIAAAKHTRNDALIAAAQRLKHEVKLGFLSNIGSGTMDGVFPRDERDALFDAEVLSYDVHLAKPDPEIFRLMAKRLGLTPEECIMVDDLEENCRGAEIAGMQSIRHETNHETMQKIHQLLDRNV